MAQESSQQRSPGIIDRFNSGVGTLRNARRGLALGRFIAGQGARAAGSALAGATTGAASGVGIPIAVVVISLLIITFFIVGFGGAPGDSGMPGGNISPTISPPGGGTPIISPSPRPYCSRGTGLCSPENLRNYFDSEEKAIKASIVCQGESGGDPAILNDGCLRGRSVDYSIGLFQINLLAHCPGAFSSYTWDPPSCTIGSRDLLNACISQFSDPVENINKAVTLSRNGTSWSPWGVAVACGIN